MLGPFRESQILAVSSTLTMKISIFPFFDLSLTGLSAVLNSNSFSKREKNLPKIRIRNQPLALSARRSLNFLEQRRPTQYSCSPSKNACFQALKLGRSKKACHFCIWSHFTKQTPFRNLYSYATQNQFSWI